jgi:hypothetical protein
LPRDGGGHIPAGKTRSKCGSEDHGLKDVREEQAIAQSHFIAGHAFGIGAAFGKETPIGGQALAAWSHLRPGGCPGIGKALDAVPNARQAWVVDTMGEDESM